MLYFATYHQSIKIDKCRFAVNKYLLKYQIPTVDNLQKHCILERELKIPVKLCRKVADCPPKD